MGFDDGYTAVSFRGKPASDKQRTRVIGNSFPVPILAWIGKRIQLLEERKCD